jgi:hypothetical protein
MSRRSIAVLGMLFVVSAFAASNDRPGPQNGRRRPPREAMEACKEKSSGASCEFSGKHGKISGKCWSPDSSKPLACKPDHAPSQEGRPPQDDKNRGESGRPGHGPDAKDI